MDAQLLDDYAAGVLAGVLAVVLAGVKCHHTYLMGHRGIETWRTDALGTSPWADPDRAEHGTPFTRRD